MKEGTHVDFLTPEVFNALIIANLIVGFALAAVRFRQDLAHSRRATQQDITESNRSQTKGDKPNAGH
jgi:hypothetical protein